MNRNLLLSALICVNVVLLAALAVLAYTPPPANAQVGLAGNYLVVTGEVQDEFDAMYVLNPRSRMLYALTYNRGTRRLDLGGYRDLSRDLRND